MGIMLATLCLNEMEWLPRLYEQHRRWPELERWVFVESADRMFAETNPDCVSSEGLSVDGTGEWLRSIALIDPLVTYIPHGISEHEDPAKCKVAARQRYLEIAGDVQPEFFITLDADEFYTYEDQQRVLDRMRASKHDGYIFPRREIWRPPSIVNEPLLSYEARGFFWNIPCCHWWRWSPGVCYRDCHNSPQHANGVSLVQKAARLHRTQHVSIPQMVHLGFASQKGTRTAKNRYYEARGEALDTFRYKYTIARKSWETWLPGEQLPYGGEVVPYIGPVPEIFSSEAPCLSQG